jgi:hypothetical protein
MISTQPTCSRTPWLMRKMPAERQARDLSERLESQYLSHSLREGGFAPA